MYGSALTIFLVAFIFFLFVKQIFFVESCTQCQSPFDPHLLTPVPLFLFEVGGGEGGAIFPPLSLLSDLLDRARNCCGERGGGGGGNENKKISKRLEKEETRRRM